MEQLSGMLSPYRVLDLADVQGLLCGKLLGDLGADVVKIEPPGGDPARQLGPFYEDDADVEKSLSWLAFNTSKRGITLNLGTADGREIFRRLARGADFVIESFSPGHMAGLGLGYDALQDLNPGLIMISISPFGPTGPYRDYRSSDIVLWALGDHMYPYGDGDRPPVRVSHDYQAYLNAGAQAAAAATVALYHRARTGEGQHVNVSIQEVVGRLTVTGNYDQNGVMPQRGGGRTLPSGEVIRPTIVWPCKDGDVIWMYGGGPVWAERIRPLIEWMEEEGMSNDFLSGFDWVNFDFTQTDQQMIDRIAEPTIRFFMSHTKKELFDGALGRRLLLYPVSTVADIAASEQLAAREYWVDLDHPDLGATIRYPGGFTKATEAPPRVRRRAPHIGEHNTEVYEGELGIPRKELVMLSRAGVI